MKQDPLLGQVQRFLQSHYLAGRPLLLGLSGGGDSLALLYLLLEIRRFYFFDLHIAHLDHGWREESQEEAESLRTLASRLELPFHHRRLEKQKETTNLEEKGREARLAFFTEIYNQGNFQALLLAHHADDQIETVLKRLFEGANFLALEGMGEVTERGIMAIWRPLLHSRRKEIRLWLEKKGGVCFEDPTNRDRRFLRARLRYELLPLLAEKFGKNVSTHLLQLSKTAAEMRSYLEEKVAPYKAAIQQSPFGAFLDLTPFSSVHDLELRVLLKNLLGRDLSGSTLLSIIQAIQAQKADVKFCFKSCTLFLDRGMLFLVNKPLPIFKWRTPLEEKSFVDGAWQWSISMGKGEEISDWRNFFIQGKACIPFSGGEYEIIPTALNMPYPSNSSIRNWWSKQRVPAFLRTALPVLWQGNKIVSEFLTGKRISSISRCILLEVKSLHN